jgi:hydroxyacylglutathione hydrolase
MFWNRNRPSPLIRSLVGLLFSLPTADRFMPDFFVSQGDRLSEYGFDAEGIELPGHSKGSIGLLTEEGDLFCGDLLANVGHLTCRRLSTTAKQPRPAWRS